MLVRPWSDGTLKSVYLPLLRHPLCFQILAIETITPPRTLNPLVVATSTSPCPSVPSCPGPPSPLPTPRQHHAVLRRRGQIPLLLLRVYEQWPGRPAGDVACAVVLAQYAREAPTFVPWRHDSETTSKSKFTDGVSRRLVRWGRAGHSWLLLSIWRCRDSRRI